MWEASPSRVGATKRRATGKNGIEMSGDGRNERGKRKDNRGTEGAGTMQRGTHSGRRDGVGRRRVGGLRRHDDSNNAGTVRRDLGVRKTPHAPQRLHAQRAAVSEHKKRAQRATAASTRTAR
jgi:hypothetical protein